MDDQITDLLMTGCDERIFARKASGSNKYHLHPLAYPGLLQRGSCTCNPLTPEGHRVARQLVADMETTDYEVLAKEQTGAIKRLLKCYSEDEFEVVFSPSGSDAMYVPLMFQSVLNPGEKVINIVTCPEELGSGSRVAAEGRYFAEWNQFTEQVPMNSPVAGLPEVETTFLAARDETGCIADRRTAIRELINAHPGQPIVGNLVFGSKSGIKDDLDIIDEFLGSVMWVVDMCQFRTDRALIHSLIGKRVILMVTGSKFYQAPPFCGALLVPKPLVTALNDGNHSRAAALDKLFSRYDFPEAMPGFVDQLPDRKNWGLRLRWQIALDEMTAYMAIPRQHTNGWIRRWSRVLIGHLAQNDTFTLMPDLEMGNDSIVSFGIVVGGRQLGLDELKILFNKLVTAELPQLGEHHRAFIGQPVKYSNGAFIRLAVGSNCVRTQLAEDRFDIRADLALLATIEEMAIELYG